MSLSCGLSKCVLVIVKRSVAAQDVNHSPLEFCGSSANLPMVFVVSSSERAPTCALKSPARIICRRCSRASDIIVEIVSYMRCIAASLYPECGKYAVMMRRRCVPVMTSMYAMRSSTGVKRWMYFAHLWWMRNATPRVPCSYPLPAKTCLLSLVVQNSCFCVRQVSLIARMSHCAP